MKLRVEAFGIARDIVGGHSVELDLPGDPTVGSLREFLMNRYPRLNELRQLGVAVNQSYAQDDSMILHQQDEIVLIPPVSGG